MPIVIVKVLTARRSRSASMAASVSDIAALLDLDGAVAGVAMACCGLTAESSGKRHSLQIALLWSLRFRSYGEVQYTFFQEAP